MIEGWITAEVSGKVLEARLPSPHEVVYRDGKIAAPTPNAITELVVVGDIGGTIEAEAGTTSDNDAALIIKFQILEVFHAFLLDYVAYRFGWLECEVAPETEWGACTSPPPTEWEVDNGTKDP